MGQSPAEMGAAASSLSCCACMAAQSLCSCLDGNLGYPLIVLLFTLMGLVFRFNDDAQSSLHWLADYGGFGGCDGVEPEVKNLCLGTQFVLRLGFTLSIFFAAMMCLVACCRKKAHDGAFFFKFFAIAAAFVVSLWIPDSNLYRFGKVAAVGAGFFIAAQVLCLLEFAYAWNEDWRSRDGAGENKWKYAILVIAIVFLLGFLGFVIASYVLFTPSGCGGGVAQVTLTLLTGIFFTVLSMTFWCEHGAILPSSCIALYSGYYCFSALSSWPSQHCNKLYDDSGNDSGSSIISVIIGLILTVLGVAYSAMTTANQIRDEEVVQVKTQTVRSGDIEQPLTSSDENSADGASIWSLMRYHIVMMLASMYMTMVLCSWEIDSPDTSTLQNFGINNWSMIVKLVSQWVAVVLYIWTLIAPKAFPNRKFEFA